MRLVRVGVGYGAALALVTETTPAHAGTADPLRGRGECRVSLVASEASDAWKEAAGDLESRLRASPDESSDCGGVSVHVTEDGAIIVFLTRDGRQAVRHISSPSDLVPVVEVLAVTVAATVAQPIQHTPAADLAEQPAARPLAITSPGAHVIVGARVGGRLGSPGGFASALLGGAAAVTVGRWELGVVGQWDPVHTLIGGSAPAGFQMSSFGVGVNVGRREPVGPVAVVGGGVLSVGITNESGATADAGTGATGTGQGSGEGAAGSSRAEPRAGAYVGIVVPERSRWRARFELGADVVASRLGRTRTIDAALPALPWWTATTSVGVEWEIP